MRAKCIFIWWHHDTPRCDSFTVRLDISTAQTLAMKFNMHSSSRGVYNFPLSGGYQISCIHRKHYDPFECFFFCSQNKIHRSCRRCRCRRVSWFFLFLEIGICLCLPCFSTFSLHFTKGKKNFRQLIFIYRFTR